MDLAAEYLEAEFRRANLESPANGEYAQIADYIEVTEHPETVQFSIAGTGEPARQLSGDRIEVESSRAVHLAGEPVFKWAPNARGDITLAGKILMLRMPADPSTVGKLALLQPSAIVLLSRDLRKARNAPRLIPVENDAHPGQVILTVPEAEMENAFDRLPTGLTSARASVQIGTPTTRPVRLRNAVGILRGSDTKLREQCIVISAHYNHLGIAAEGDDRIFNGANDNASGVATVIELAHAFAHENRRPARSLVFVCFFGEEKGLLGSAWYVKHPVFPLNRTVANLNFEQLGEPASNEGLPPGSLGVTGYNVSDLPELVAPSLLEAGIELRDVRHNEEYFERSDNLSFAARGDTGSHVCGGTRLSRLPSRSDEWPRLN